MVAKNQTPTSIEAGHVYAEAYEPDARPSLVQWFERIHAVTQIFATASDPIAFMIDDYHQRPGRKFTPADIIGKIIKTSREVGLPLHYIAREAACVPVGQQILELLQASDHLRTADNGSIWLTHTTPQDTQPAAKTIAMQSEAPPQRSRDPIETDVELYKKIQKPYACPLLAAAWHTLRLGILSDAGFEKPGHIDDLASWNTWEGVPALIQVSDSAPAFVGSQNYSVLPVAFIGVEAAVSQILGQLSIAMEVPPIPDRLSYYFMRNV